VDKDRPSHHIRPVINRYQTDVPRSVVAQELKVVYLIQILYPKSKVDNNTANMRVL
jgi:hypothetical protein